MGAYLVLAVAMGIVAAVTRARIDSGPGAVLFWICVLGFLVLTTMASIQRAHDMDWSGWSVLMILIPFVAASPAWSGSSRAARRAPTATVRRRRPTPGAFASSAASCRPSPSSASSRPSLCRPIGLHQPRPGSAGEVTSGKSTAAKRQGRPLGGLVVAKKPLQAKFASAKFQFTSDVRKVSTNF